MNLFNSEYNKHPKLQCNPSSLDINSLENVNPDIKPLFFNQNIEQKLAEKNKPSTIIKPINLSEKLLSFSCSVVS